MTPDLLRIYRRQLGWIKSSHSIPEGQRVGRIPLPHSASPQFPPAADRPPSGGEGLLPLVATPSHPVRKPLSVSVWHPGPSMRGAAVHKTQASGQSQCFGLEYFGESYAQKSPPPKSNLPGFPCWCRPLATQAPHCPEN